jgi:hypothetical protein
MNSAQDISDFKPPALSGVLVCDALMLREGSAAADRKSTTSTLAGGHPRTLVKK